MAAQENPDSSPRKRYLGWHHGLINVLYLLALHVILVAWLWYGRDFVNAGIYLITALLVSVVYFRILTEWFHEATHWNLVPDRRLNDWLGDFLIGTPIGTRVQSNRPGHFRHHATNEFFVEDDPDTSLQGASSRRELISGIAKDLCGYTAMVMFWRATRLGAESARGGAGSTLAWFVWLVIVHGSLLLLTINAARYEIYPIYVFSLICLYPVANRFRLCLQHAAVRDDGSIYLIGSGVSRTCHGSLLAQLFLQSPMIMYHFEHHAQPSLPYRALRAISKPSDDPNQFSSRSMQLIGAALGRLS